MVGFITERDFGAAEEAFPGIVQFFDSLPSKPRTFLELASQFEAWEATRSQAKTDERTTAARTEGVTRCS
jgi:hypothetical protein